MMRVVALPLLLAVALPAQAKLMCGSAKLSEGPVEIEVRVTQRDVEPQRTTWTRVEVASADRAYRLAAHYRPDAAQLGGPTSLEVRASVELPMSRVGDPEQVVWRVDSGPWADPIHWVTPRAISDATEDRRGEVDYRLAQAPPLEYRTDLLEAASRGARFDFRRLDPWERELGSGSVIYPAFAKVDALYQAARAQASAKLWPCGEGIGGTIPPMVTQAMRRPAGPPEPETPAMLQANACSYLRSNARRAAEKQPAAGKKMKILAQPADCAARTVRRVYQTLGMSTRDRRELGRALSTMAGPMWCSDKSYRTFIAQGWAFTVELRADDDAEVFTVTTTKCDP